MSSHSHLLNPTRTIIIASLCLTVGYVCAKPSSLPTVADTIASNVVHRSPPSALHADISRLWSAQLTNAFKLVFNSHWSMVTAAAILGLCPCIWLFNRQVPELSNSDAASSDPGLLKKHSEFKSYTTSKFTYPSIRTFFREHPRGAKLPTKPSPNPLLVFIHGLGGSVAQFHPLLISLVNIAPCLSIDLPGCGLSRFEPTRWDAYELEALVQLLAEAIEQHRDHETNQKVVLIGHSMGCSLASLLASTTSPYKDLISQHVNGLIAICPSSAPPDAQKTATFKKLLSIPGPIFDLWRRWDRRGGIDSQSVRRFVGEGAEEETRKLQVRFNEQSRTPVWRRMARGLLPSYESGVIRGGIPGREVWSGLRLPMFLAAGEADPITPAGEVAKIVEYLGKTATATTAASSGEIPGSAAPVDIDLADKTLNLQKRDSQQPSITASFRKESNNTLTTTHEDSPLVQTVVQSSNSKLIVKTTILPSPASHALLYAPSTSRILAGLIQTFLATHIDHRLSLGWQLQYLTTEGKWDVKNLAKWTGVTPVSTPIAHIFRAMKTLREVDERHSPKVFVREWQGKIRTVVDISHENPVYDPKGLEAGGIAYRKFPTVSKLPPQLDEVAGFIALIDGLRGVTPEDAHDTPRHDGKGLIGVHCHYGFNRTGFFLVCYLVERMRYRLQDAIEEFERCRPPGIRHAHFIDELNVRYCVGLKRNPTL